WDARPRTSCSATRTAFPASWWTPTCSASRGGSGSRARPTRSRSSPRSCRSCRARAGPSSRTGSSSMDGRSARRASRAVRSARSLVPPLARRAVPLLERLGDAVAGRPGLAGASLGAFLAGAALALPDRIQFVGDYLLRVGTARGQIPTATVFPQALPLDLALHYTVPSRLASIFGGDPNDVSRVIGAIEAALFAGLAVAFARAAAARRCCGCRYGRRR